MSFDFNVGHDCTVNFTNPFTGAAISWGNLTEFQSSPETKSIESTPLGSPPQFADPPHGWRGSFTVDRIDATVDDFFAGLENKYWNGGLIPDATITEYIADAKTGAIHSYQYVGVSLKLDDAGRKQSQDKITQKVSFRSSQRLKLS